MATIDFTVRGLAAIDAPSAGRVTYWDGSCRGFGLRVSQSGQKSWVVMYRVNGRQRFYTIGDAHRLPLADARALAKEALYQAAKGEDPAAEKARGRVAETFGDMADEYLERHAKVNKKSWKADERMLEADVLPYWGTLKAGDIRRRDVISLLDKHVARGAPIVANRVLALVRKVFNFGLQRDMVEFNPCQAVCRPVDEKSRQGQRVLNFDEIRSVWSAIDKESSLISAIFKLRLLTAQRGSEIRSAAWSEFDFESGWWTIPGNKTKNSLQHRVPITDQIRAILDRLSKETEFVFPSPNSTARTAHIDNIQKAFQRIKTESKVEFQDRDLRRTAASHMTGELGVPRFVVSKVLNHMETGITRVYDRHSYDQEKRHAVDAWNRLLERILSNEERPNLIRLKVGSE